MLLHEGEDFQQMADFVKQYIENRDPIASGLVTRFRFRNRFDHCLRCSVWSRRIAPLENADVEIAVISSLFHDIGKSQETPTMTHGEAGSVICDEYLTSINYDIKKKDHIVQNVRFHSDHTYGDRSSREAMVMQDSDLLDEIGALTVLWDAMACGEGDDPSYEKARQSIDAQYSRLASQPENWLHTETARQFFQERLAFLGDFLNNLEYELGNSLQFKNLFPR